MLSGLRYYPLKKWNFELDYGELKSLTMQHCTDSPQLPHQEALHRGGYGNCKLKGNNIVREKVLTD